MSGLLPGGQVAAGGVGLARVVVKIGFQVPGGGIIVVGVTVVVVVVEAVTVLVVAVVVVAVGGTEVGDGGVMGAASGPPNIPNITHTPNAAAETPASSPVRVGRRPSRCRFASSRVNDSGTLLSEPPLSLIESYTTYPIFSPNVAT